MTRDLENRAVMVRHFLSLLPPESRSVLEALPDLEQLLEESLASAAAAWPALSVPADRFMRYLAERVPSEGSIARALRTLCVEDLYLCCACADGDEQAIAVFQHESTPLIRNTVLGLRLSETMADEVQQQLMERLLVGGVEQPPGINAYGGYGPLSRWLRVVASRTARRMLEKEKRLMLVGDAPIADEMTEAAVDELARAKPVYRELFKKAINHALQTLSARDMNLLRQRFVDGLGLEQIGAIYRVHHTTVHRWLERVKSTLLERTETHMREELEISAGDCQSIIRLIQSELDLTLQTFLSGKPSSVP